MTWQIVVFSPPATWARATTARRSPLKHACTISRSVAVRPELNISLPDRHNSRLIGTITAPSLVSPWTRRPTHPARLLPPMPFAHASRACIKAARHFDAPTEKYDAALPTRQARRFDALEKQVETPARNGQSGTHPLMLPSPPDLNTFPELHESRTQAARFRFGRPVEVSQWVRVTRWKAGVRRADLRPALARRGALLDTLPALGCPRTACSPRRSC